jgi:hypothetical protein
VADPISIHYSRDVGWSGALIVELCRSDPSTVLVTFNYDGRPEIGVYRTQLSEEAFRRTLEEVHRSGYASLAPPGPFEPEAKFIVIGERLQGDAVPKICAFDLRALPPALAALGTSVEQVATEVRRHPSRVVWGTAEWSKPVFDTVEPLSVRVTLTNAGVLPLTLANPLSPTREGGLQLVVRDAVGSTRTVEIDAAQLRPRPYADQGDLITLSPGDKLAFSLKKKVYLPPGDYAGRLAYRNLVDVVDNPQFVDGELWLELGAVSVQHRAPS